MELTDWRGNTFIEGDKVIYPRAVGYAVELVEAVVLEIKSAKNVRVQPIRSSRTNFGAEGDRSTYSWPYGDKPVTLTKGVASITVVDPDDPWAGV